MKKKMLVFFTALIGSTSLFAQTGKGFLTPTTSSSLISHQSSMDIMEQDKTIQCVDTLRYPQIKEQTLGTSTFYIFNVRAANNESISQTFLNSGTLSITGIEFFGRRNSSATSAATVTVNAAIYNVNAANVPTTLVGSGNVSLSSTSISYYYVNFTIPITISGNYAVVLTATNPNGILDYFVNNITASQPYDEGFTHYKSNYYPNSSGSFVSIPVLTTGDAANFPTTFNFEPLVAPVVNYTINTNYTPSATSVCQGTAVTFSNNTTPIGAFTNRMVNRQVFNSHFGIAASDSTFVYSMDNGSPLIWSDTTTYTHPNAGDYNVSLISIGGFLNSCLDINTQQITVNPIPTAPTITPGGPTTFCDGGSVILTSSSASGNTWSTGETTQSITVNSASTVTVTASALGCTSPSSAPQTITITPLDNANFNYPINSICVGSSNQTPTTSVAGSFSSTPAGLTFVNATTGEIDVIGSTAGTYTVSYTTTGTCPNTSNQTITVTASPDPSFTYVNTSFCTNEANPSPLFGSGATAGLFSSTAGLDFLNTNTGEINLATSSPGIYTVTNTIAASGACAAVSETFSVTINESPSAIISGGDTICDGSSTPISIALTGSAPWTVTYSDGITLTTVNPSTSPYTFDVFNAGTYSVLTVSSGGCSIVGSGSTDVIVNQNPTVTVDPVTPLCDNVDPFTLSAIPVGGTFSGTGVTGTYFDPTISSGTYTVTYDYTDGNGCVGTGSTIILVNASPDVTLDAFTDVCLDANEFTLTGGLPTGGTYTGTGVSSGLFDPSTAGVGSNTISYSFTDVNGCSSSASETILVNDCAGIDEITAFDLFIAPNPASTSINIQIVGTDLQHTTVKMVAEDGKVVLTQRSFENGLLTIDVADFARGIYYLQVESVGAALVKKVVLK